VDQVIPYLPHVNASLNALAMLLLIAGFVAIKGRRESAHRALMLGSFAVSVVFLACYLVYHVNTTIVKRFPDYPPDLVRVTYYLVLVSHILLAAAVPFMALGTIYFAWRGQLARHVRIARWTFPVWLYVSVTGVMVYLMLYQMYPPR
jgi:putative membrane protein